MANLLTIIGLFLTASLGFLTLRYVIRTDRRETAAAEAQRLRDAEERGRQQALIEARLHELERQREPGEGQP